MAAPSHGHGRSGGAPSGNGEIGKQRTQQVQDGEGVEGAGKPEVLGRARRYQTADEIARYIARDVGGECGRQHRSPSSARRDAPVSS